MGTPQTDKSSVHTVCAMHRHASASIADHSPLLELELENRDHAQGEGDNDLLAYGRTGSNEGCDLDSMVVCAER